MKYSLRSVLALVLCLCMLPSLFFLPAQAAETDETEENKAEDISSQETVSESIGLPNLRFFFDKNIYSGGESAAQASVTFSHESGIGSLYVIFKYPYGVYTMTNNDTGETRYCGENGFMHEFIDVEEAFGTAPSSVTLSFGNGAVFINEFYIYTPGAVPSSVQKWEPPTEDGTDLILFSTHGDDEQLFFAGILPYYAGELDYEVLVVYLTDHHNMYGTSRMREMLAGLWAVGVTTYPVFGPYEDFKMMDSLPATYKFFEKEYGRTKDELLGYVVEQLRRFNPKVVVGHDFNGEYRHGQHMLYADLLAQALEISNDPEQYPELAEQYGLWDVPKAYFHLYKENPIVMDWDQPLESFDGLTAFQVTQKLGFPCHWSQQKSWFYLWLHGNSLDQTKASQITKYSPCEYGLYRSTVGEDVQKNDFFENLTTYGQEYQAEQERLAEEARLKAEEEARLKAEEDARLKAEEEARLALEKAEAEEQARKEAEAQAIREAEAFKQARRAKYRPQIRTVGSISVVSLALFLGLSLYFRKKENP